MFYLGHYAGRVILVLNADRTTIDVEKTEKILKHPSRRTAGWGFVRPPWPDESVQRTTRVTDAYVSVQYVVLSYKGKIFLDLSWRVHPEYSVRAWGQRATSKLYLTEGERSEEICEYGRLPQP